MRETFASYIADTTGSMAIAFLIPLVCYGVIGGYAAMLRFPLADVTRGKKITDRAERLPPLFS